MNTCNECGQQALPGSTLESYSLKLIDGHRISGDYDHGQVQWEDRVLCEACLWRDPYRIVVRDEPTKELGVVLSMREQGYPDLNGMPLVYEEDHPDGYLFLQIPRGMTPGQKVGSANPDHRVDFHCVDLHDSDGRMNAWISDSVWHEHLDYCQQCNRAFPVDQEHYYFLDAEVACPDCYFAMIFGLNFDWTDEAQKFWHNIDEDSDALHELISHAFFKESPYVHFDYEKLSERPSSLIEAASGWVGSIDDMNHSLAVDEIEEAICEELVNGPVRFCIVLDRSTHNVCSLGWQLYIDARAAEQAA